MVVHLWLHDESTLAIFSAQLQLLYFILVIDEKRYWEESLACLRLTGNLRGM